MPTVNKTNSGGEYRNHFCHKVAHFEQRFGPEAMVTGVRRQERRVRQNFRSDRAPSIESTTAFAVKNRQHGGIILTASIRWRSVPHNLLLNAHERLDSNPRPGRNQTYGEPGAFAIGDTPDLLVAARGSVKTRLWANSTLENKVFFEPTEGFDRTSRQVVHGLHRSSSIVSEKPGCWTRN